MKYREILIEQLKPLSYFNKETVFQLSKQYDIKSTTVYSYISRSLMRKDILSLKRGVYVTTDFYNKNKGEISYSFFLANILRAPSYVSSWTALQYYNLNTEAIHNITSVTEKVSRYYVTKVGNFTYQSMKKNIFSGFSLVKGKFDFFIATPSKALFDLLYFKTNQFRGIKFEDVGKIVEGLRIDIDEMEESERNKFYKMIKEYLHHE